MFINQSKGNRAHPLADAIWLIWWTLSTFEVRKKKSNEKDLERSDRKVSHASHLKPICPSCDLDCLGTLVSKLIRINRTEDLYLDHLATRLGDGLVRMVEPHLHLPTNLWISASLQYGANLERALRASASCGRLIGFSSLAAIRANQFRTLSPLSM